MRMMNEDKQELMDEFYRQMMRIDHSYLLQYMKELPLNMLIQSLMFDTRYQDESYID